MGKKEKKQGVAPTNPSKKSKESSEADLVEPISSEDPAGEIVKLQTQLNTLKERFNQLYSLRMTEPELQCKAQNDLAAEEKHAFDALLQKMQTQHELELGLLQEKLARIMEESAIGMDSVMRSTATTTTAGGGDDKIIALLDTFKLMTGMYIHLEEEENEQSARGTVTLLNSKKQGVKFAFVVTSDHSVKFTPGPNCKKLLPSSLGGSPVELSVAEVPPFVCSVLTHLFAL